MAATVKEWRSVMSKAKTPAPAPRKAARKKPEEEAVAAPDPAPEVTGSEALYFKYLPAAKGLDARDVLVLGADPTAAYQNAVVGRDAVLAERAAIDATGFKARWNEIEDVADIALATDYAHGLVEPNERSTGEVLAWLREGSSLRAVLLSDARTRALENPAYAKDVKDIEKGGGPTDSAQDLIDLSTFFKKHKLVNPKGAATPARLARAVELGTELLKRLKPAGTKRVKKRSPETLAAIDNVNRLWTLFAHRYHHVACAGGARWGRDVVDHVPAPQARYVVKKKPAAKPVTG